MGRPTCAFIAVFVALVHARPASAHEGENVIAHGPSSWDMAVMLLLVAAGAMYVIGTLQLSRRGARVRTVERAAFWVGWAVMLAAVAPPMDWAAIQAARADRACRQNDGFSTSSARLRPRCSESQPRVSASTQG